MKSVQGNLHILATGNIGKLLWDYSLPAVVGMLVMSLYNVIDRIFIGQGVGPEAIAGLAITFPVMNISAALGVLIGAGASARVSILLGAKNQKGAENVLGNSLVLILMNATVYLTVFAIFLDDILRLFGASDASLPYAHDFMMYILPGMLVMNIGFTLNNIMRASGYPVKAMTTMFLGAGCNLVLAPLFIFGFGWGIRGAALATDIAMTVFALRVVHHFTLKQTTLRFVHGSFRLRWHVVLSIIGIGAAPSLVNLASCFINVIINTRLYKYGGDSAVAASGIFVTVTSLLTMVVVGICQGMQPIVGYNYGAGQLSRLRRAYFLAVACGTIIVSMGALVGLTCPSVIARAFTTDASLIAVTDNALRISMLAFCVVGFQIVSTTFFQSIGKVGKSIFLSLVRQVIFLIPFLLLLSDRYGLNGVWYAFPASDVLATVVTFLMIVWELRQISRKVEGKKALTPHV